MTPTDRPTREDALKALDKLYSLIREGNYMLAENPRNVLEAYIKNTPYEPLAVEQSAEAAKEQPVKVGRGSAIVIDRDKVPVGLKGAILTVSQTAEGYIPLPFARESVGKVLKAAALVAEKV